MFDILAFLAFLCFSIAWLFLFIDEFLRGAGLRTLQRKLGYVVRTLVACEAQWWEFWGGLWNAATRMCFATQLPDEPPLPPPTDPVPQPAPPPTPSPEPVDANAGFIGLVLASLNELQTETSASPDEDDCAAAVAAASAAASAAAAAASAAAAERRRQRRRTRRAAYRAAVPGPWDPENTWFRIADPTHAPLWRHQASCTLRHALPLGAITADGWWSRPSQNPRTPGVQYWAHSGLGVERCEDPPPLENPLLPPPRLPFFRFLAAARLHHGAPPQDMWVDEEGNLSPTLPAPPAALPGGWELLAHPNGAPFFTREAAGRLGTSQLAWGRAPAWPPPVPRCGAAPLILTKVMGGGHQMRGRGYGSCRAAV